MPKHIPRYLFDRRDYKMLSLVNEVISSGRTTPFAHIELYVHFHPEGIKELAESRGLRIAYATILLLQSLTTGRLEDRLGALSALRDEVIDTAIGPMPRNTARVLLQIMKELVRAHGDQRRQLELAHDFRAAASGKPRVIRRQLRQYHLIEMPEAWNQVAFDDHVHDANTKGRKSPTHLIMDAWIKGIRRLRVIYYNHISSKSATELIQAAQIMGITLRMGIEFSACFRGKYAQLIWVPRGFHDDQAFLCFLEEPETVALMQAGVDVSVYQEKYVCALLHAFNARHRDAFNAVYDIDLPVLEETAFLAYVAPGQASLLHLAKYIHAQFLSRLPQAMARLRTTYQAAADATERCRIEAQVDRLNRLSADTILDDYLKPRHNPEIPDVSVPHDDPLAPALLQLSPKAVIDRLIDLRSAYRITLNLSNITVEDALEILYDCEGKITRLEIFNLKDYAAGLTHHIPPIIELQQAINQGNVIALKRIIRQTIVRLAQTDPPDTGRIDRLSAILHDIVSLKAFYAGIPLVSRIGSDSTGGAPYSHGMGLVVDDTLPWRSRRDIRRKDNDRLRLPITVCVSPVTIYRPGHLTGMMAAVRRLPGMSRAGLRRENHWETLEQDVRLVPEGNIVTLGGIQGVPENGLRLSPQPDTEKSIRRALNLNSLLKNGLKVAIGFLPAFATFALTKDWWLLAYGGAFIWFGITGLRNIVQSVLGGGGWRRSPLLRWNDLISWERITDSLLYTGFSVPLLDYVTKTVLLERCWNITTSTQPVMLYTLMALANGIYLSSHNIFRGLPRGAVVGNFFRSILSIPLAIGLNAGIGFMVTGMGFGPAAPILQKWAAIISKTASDVVAGIIEGAADRFQNIDRRRRAIGNKIKQILDTYTELEILLPEAQAMEYLQNPEKLGKVPADAQDMAKRMYVHALDLLYFWMYQPRARNAFRALIEELSPDESRIVLQAQTVLYQQRPISQLFIDGILGQGFSRPLAFYLAQSPAYLAEIEVLIAENEAAYAACCQAPVDPKVLDALQSKGSKKFSAEVQTRQGRTGTA
ncbi:MAG: hypothetical protein ABIL58_16785 [Pseudomonadota bacterium]